jgi:hypothetical protein
MNPDTLPPELARRWNHLVFVKKRGQNEWSAECPQCGDTGHDSRDFPDRFRMWLNPARGWCRACGYQAFADDNQRDFKITDEQRQQWITERLQRENQERLDAEHAIELLRHEQAWLHYHDALDNYSRAWWEKKGVPNYMVNYFHLGYCASRIVWTAQGEWMTPTATIPIFAPGWQAVNIRHRLINPPSPGDKYRPERAGLPASAFLTNPDDQPSGETIIVEGEIKSIIIFDRLDTLKITVIGLPGKNPKADVLRLLDQCEPIHIVFDPGAERQAGDLARMLGKRARIVTLPVKPDDLFTMYGGEREDFYQALRQGRKAA